MPKVKLTYFPYRGKYYAEGEFATAAAPWAVYRVVRDLRTRGMLPGLVPGTHPTFHILVEDGGNSLPEHFIVPGLIMALEPETED